MSQLQGSELQRPLQMQRLGDFWLSDMSAWREESPSWVRAAGGAAMTIHPLLLLLVLSIIPCQLPGMLHRAPQPPGSHAQPYSAIQRRLLGLINMTILTSFLVKFFQQHFRRPLMP